ncbi:MAG: FtsQ-type POTRA domain-containing protein [Chloracidobacterium sp.]|nr:FtsQ-type POTRA domain-containing protein [Chloracidobacterium sp.]MDW8217587.1 FtsQ-type POTRA domain-containing protein [Acidobacteriota bacterium]
MVFAARTPRQVLPSRRKRMHEAAVVSSAWDVVSSVGRRLRSWQSGVIWMALLASLTAMGTAMTRSSLFTLRRVEVIGCQSPLAEDVERAVRQQATGSLLTVSLPGLRRHLESLARVRRVSVVRILPDTVRVVVEERKPVVLAQMAERGSLVWLDDEGVVLGAYNPETDGEPPSVVVGFASDREPSGQRENRMRLQLYRNLMWALDAAEPRLSERIESVDLSHLEDVRVQLRNSRIVVGLGREDFRARLLHACEIIDALQRRDVAILERLRSSEPHIFEKAPFLKSVTMVSLRDVHLGFDERAAAVSSRSSSGTRRPAPPRPTRATPTTNPRSQGVTSRR